VSRIEEQMKWIQPNPAVPLNGKRLVSDQTAIVRNGTFSQAAAPE
jgi:hypothetical protein